MKGIDSHITLHNITSLLHLAVWISDGGVKKICKMGSELGLGSTFQGKVLHFMLSPVTRCATLNQFPQNTKLHKIMIIT